MALFDFMGWGSSLAPGQSGMRPTAAQLGLSRSAYASKGWYSGAASTGAVDVAGARLIAGCLPSSVPMLLDLEPWLQYMQTFDANGRLTPTPNIATFASAIATTVNAMRATPNGAGRTIMPYASINGQFNPDNGAAWIAAWKATNEAMYLAPYPGAPNGIGALFDYALVSCYTVYQDQALNDRRIDGLIDEARRLYPNKPIVGLLWWRYPAGQADPNLRYDFIPEARFERECLHVRARCNHAALFDFNGYGVPGTTAAQRDANGYAVAGGMGWNPNLPQWAAFRRVFAPQSNTMPYTPGGYQTGGTRTR